MTRTARATTTLAARSISDPNPQSSLVIEALRRMKRSGYSALKDISIDSHGDSLRLRGRVTTYYLKQVALSIVVQIEGVRRVLNHIEVADSTSRPRPSCDPASRSYQAVESESSPQS